MFMEQDRRPPAARWLQPNPVPFWASRLFFWNLVFLSLIVSVIAVWLLVVEPRMAAKDREASLKESATKKYEPRDPKAPRDVRFERMLDKVVDDVDPELRDEPYRYLVKYLSTVDPARLAEQAYELDYDLVSKRPEEVRGLTVRLNLMFFKAPYGPVRLDPPVGGVKAVTRTYFATSGPLANEVYFVDFVEPLPEIESEAYAVMDAVFLRRVKYERGDRTGEFHTAPLFLARNVAKVQPPPVPSGFRFRWVVVALAVGMLGFLTLITLKTWMAGRTGGPAPRRLDA